MNDEQRSAVKQTGYRFAKKCNRRKVTGALSLYAILVNKNIPLPDDLDLDLKALPVAF